MGNFEIRIFKGGKWCNKTFTTREDMEDMVKKLRGVGYKVEIVSVSTMKTREEILQAIEQIETTWKDVQEVPDYVRGQYNILKWILGEEVNNE